MLQFRVKLGPVVIDTFGGTLVQVGHWELLWTVSDPSDGRELVHYRCPEAPGCGEWLGFGRRLVYDVRPVEAIRDGMASA